MQSDDGEERVVVGSIQELEELTGAKVGRALGSTSASDSA